MAADAGDVLTADGAGAAGWEPLGVDLSLHGVLGVGNDAFGYAIVGLADPTDDQDAATKKYVADSSPGLQTVITKSHTAEGTILRNVDQSGTDSLAADGTRTISHAAGTTTFHADGSVEINSTFVGTVIRVAAGVPTGAPDPTLQELPFAVDTTSVTGGLYFWYGAAWVQISVIP